MFAEVWPSWWPVRPEPGDAEGQGAGPHGGRHLRRGRTAPANWCAGWPGPPVLSAEQVRTIETEEAWTLGVMAPRSAQAACSHRPLPNLPLPAGGEGRGEGARRRMLPPSLTRPALPRRRTPIVRGGLAPRCSDRPSYDYLRDPAAIYERSFALVREAADLGRFPAALRPLAVRLAHAAGDVSILDDLAWSRGAVARWAARAGERRPDPRRQRDGRIRHHGKRGCRPATP